SRDAVKRLILPRHCFTASPLHAFSSHLQGAGGPGAAVGAELAVLVGEDAVPNGGGVGGLARGARGVGAAVGRVLVVVLSDHAVGFPFGRRLVTRRIRPARPDVVDAALGVAVDGRLGPDVAGDLVEAVEVVVGDVDRGGA